MSEQNTGGYNSRFVRLGASLALASALALAGCDEGAKPSFLKPKKGQTTSAAPSQSTKLVERDVEAPDVFQVTEAGLWDGRPSIGGVWVAHPDVTDPERVIIRNNANGKFVIGALFRREREIPGPRLQVSSDAAAALSMIAGAPIELNVTALRREAQDAPVETDAEPQSDVTASGPEVADAAEISEVETSALDPIAGAAAAIEASAPPQTVPAPRPRPEPQPSAPSALTKPYIQIGIFSVEANATRTADQMRNAGIVPTVYEQASNGKPFWRVVVGPAQSKSERSALLKSVKEAGFSDAYAVTH